MNIKQKLDEHGYPCYNVIPKKGMSWTDLADAICEHCNLSIRAYRSFVWTTGRPKDGGKWMWYAKFFNSKGEDITRASCCETVEAAIEYAIKVLIGNTRVRSPYAVFVSAEKDYNWNIIVEERISFGLKLS